jgi:hypothetical protein
LHALPLSRGILHAVCPVLDLTLGLILSDAVTLLDAANELVLLAVDDRKIIVGKFASLLLHLAGDLLPVSSTRFQFMSIRPFD